MALIFKRLKMSLSLPQKFKGGGGGGGFHQLNKSYFYILNKSVFWSKQVRLIDGLNRKFCLRKF